MIIHLLNAALSDVFTQIYQINILAMRERFLRMR